MAAVSTAWKVLEHGPLERLEDNLWRVEGALPNMALRRVMAVARLVDGRLVIHSAIALPGELMEQLEAWGRPSYLLVPNAYHRLDAPAYKARYPDLVVVCPREARKAVEKAVPVDMTYEEFEGDATVVVRPLVGTRGREGVLVVRHGDRASLVVNDLIFNMPHLHGVVGFMLKHVMKSSGGPRISRVARMLVVKDRRELADELEALAETPGLCRIVVSHHETITDAPAEVLRSQARALRG